MNSRWDDRMRPNPGRRGEDPSVVQELIANARKFITGETVDPELLLGYEGTVWKFVDSSSNKNDTTSHQLRKFYSDIVDMWEIAEKSSGNQTNPDISKLKIRLAMMEARLNYAKERGVLTGDIFKLLTACVSTVNRETGTKWVESLERFRTFFEAFIAYSYKRK
ncbi:MAG: type III-A CRISPR-associated protein Csm2 [Thermoplasmata archaeon]